ncbi:MAG: F0F1 ATP synthase subunit gamma [Candidatus Jettenia sp.]|uniref:F0F1 ATP synthase gamma subunit n=1 Tax=Candidatus Jettenia caeni TaxID=247490 RepID=I3ILM9_9BACT|nr:F0F1 ATP synthase subunit gamma [Candidatus Jettenia sp. AMX1]MBC6927352.1 F0F1 ATP synthase subunit gamma [Candidatus Jettenia sp.]GAB62624.1 F0F1 ATP synthase gamma subunit [Candidatus Jettenia caeni]KAA0251729.1 MAG: F0F1 ATP synthase subunit gamma [Candidatus Jettenia sp. AMX1]MCE7879035.1 F0F1 ATP synthase subunit gamma [Candidatus Jettenia sp. AMX1]MCQ3925781.1 F0F1 ATP synthase subunit gamma [Candidatus Jettenia sp.]
METYESLRGKLRSAQELKSIVRTMKTIAAVAIRQYERAVESLSEYNRAVELGFQFLLKKEPERVMERGQMPGGNLCAIVFGSDQGMCGQFNDRIVSFAIDNMNRIQKPEGRILLGIGVRVAARLEGEKQPVEEQFSVPGSVEGITSMVQKILIRIEDLRSNKEIDQIIIFYHKRISGSTYNPRMVYLLPLNKEWLRSLEEREWPARVLPLYTMDWNQLFSALIRQYLFFLLYRASAESLASENASRLSSMQAAEKNIEDRLEELRTQFNQQRQDSITAEMMDIVAGFEALTSERREEQFS